MANSGWTNDAIDSLTVPTGATSGERVIIANQANGDAIDIYNTANQLVFAIDGSGRLFSYSTVNTAEVLIEEATLEFPDSAFTAVTPPFVRGGVGALQSVLQLSAGIPPGAAGVGDAELLLTTGDSSSLSWIQGQQRGESGALVQLTTGANAGQLMVAGLYTATVVGAAGMATFNHNCPFTPTAGFAAPLTHFSQWNWNDAFGTHGFNATQAQITMFQPGGAVVAAGVAATLFGLFLG